MQLQNIIFIGMPGAGKSTIGSIVAKRLGMSFLDTDALIQQRDGRFLQCIINQDGVEEFLKKEEETILSILVDSTVIATGGSVIYSAKAITHLQKRGPLVYLKLPFEEIERRIQNMATRGIAIDKGKRFIDLYNERVILYEKYADLTLNCDGFSVEDIVVKVIASVK